MRGFGAIVSLYIFGSPPVVEGAQQDETAALWERKPYTCAERCVIRLGKLMDAFYVAHLATILVLVLNKSSDPNESDLCYSAQVHIIAALFAHHLSSIVLLFTTSISCFYNAKYGSMLFALIGVALGRLVLPADEQCPTSRLDHAIIAFPCAIALGILAVCLAHLLNRTNRDETSTDNDDSIL